ncbi:Zinc alcohol [Pleurostoma richardsiae]|uniref:Zinc alcohol n=1 Tax=Pleurostoma richardsiae TaxID=41990 RepID=A0AA38VNL9_9PEZI|nr:Zinc alcohol [Pleurostoma richardsiae]
MLRGALHNGNHESWQYADIRGGLEHSLVLNKSTPALSKESLSKGQILVEVISAALNPADYKLPENVLVRSLFIKKPATPGFDFCGRVVARQDENQSLSEGQLVFGALSPLSRYGTLSQFVIVPSSECVPLPDGVDPDHAAATGTACLTSYQALLLGGIYDGSQVIITGGSGGTGTFAIQLAKAMGARVTASCSTANVELCERLGADSVLDYRQMDIASELEKKGQVFDLAIDNVGIPGLYEKSHSFLKTDGKFMQVQFDLSAIRKSLQPRCLGGGRREFHIVVVKSKTEDLNQVGKWLKEGKVKPVVRVFDWEDVPKAYAELRTGCTVGKIVVRVARS